MPLVGGCAGDGMKMDRTFQIHGDEVISGIYVTTGFSGGADAHAWLTDLTVNGKQFHFGR